MVLTIKFGFKVDHRFLIRPYAGLVHYLLPVFK